MAVIRTYQAGPLPGLFFAALLALLLSACAGRGALQQMQTEWPEQLPRQAKLSQVPFYDNPSNHCGPASLAMLAGFHGQDVNFDELSEAMILPGKGGTLQLDIDRVSRQLGLAPYPLSGQFSDLLAHVAAGQPVLLFENLGLSWAPRWHYSVLIGYDLDRGQALLRSGNNAELWVSFYTLNNTWQRAGNWARVILPAEQAPLRVGVRQQLRVGLDLEQTRQPEAAAIIYQRLSSESALAALALANLRQQQGQYLASWPSYSQSLELEPTHSASWNNFGHALLAQCPAAAAQAMQCASRLSPQPLLQAERAQLALSWQQSWHERLADPDAADPFPESCPRLPQCPRF